MPTSIGHSRRLIRTNTGYLILMLFLIYHIFFKKIQTKFVKKSWVPVKIHSIFYKHMNPSVKAFAKHKLGLKKHKSLYVLKNLAKPFMCL